MVDTVLARIWPLAILLLAGGTKPATNPAEHPTGFQTRSIEGWTVHINERLLKDDPDLTNKAIVLMTAQLREIRRVVPAEAVGHLQRGQLWVDPAYPKTPPRAEYHPAAQWLADHGRNPIMAKGVEFTNIRIFEAENARMPCFILHELAHAYHDQVLGFDEPDILAAYKHAKASGIYDRVERFNGPGRANTFERAYAMTNHKEYFAESTEAFFGRNDFFPFTREQLKKHDPEMFELLERVWRVKEGL